MTFDDVIDLQFVIAADDDIRIAASRPWSEPQEHHGIDDVVDVGYDRSSLGENIVAMVVVEQNLVDEIRTVVMLGLIDPVLDVVLVDGGLEPLPGDVGQGRGFGELVTVAGTIIRHLLVGQGTVDAIDAGVDPDDSILLHNILAFPLFAESLLRLFELELDGFDVGVVELQTLIVFLDLGLIGGLAFLVLLVDHIELTECRGALLGGVGGKLLLPLAHLLHRTIGLLYVAISDHASDRRANQRANATADQITWRNIHDGSLVGTEGDRRRSRPPQNAIDQNSAWGRRSKMIPSQLKCSRMADLPSHSARLAKSHGSSVPLKTPKSTKVSLL